MRIMGDSWLVIWNASFREFVSQSNSWRRGCRSETYQWITKGMWMIPLCLWRDWSFELVKLRKWSSFEHLKMKYMFNNERPVGFLCRKRVCGLRYSAPPTDQRKRCWSLSRPERKDWTEPVQLWQKYPFFIWSDHCKYITWR